MQTVNHDICSALVSVLREIWMKSQMRSMCLIENQRYISLMHYLRNFFHIRYNSVVCRRGYYHRANVRIYPSEISPPAPGLSLRSSPFPAQLPDKCKADADSFKNTALYTDLWQFLAIRIRSPRNVQPSNALSSPDCASINQIMRLLRIVNFRRTLLLLLLRYLLHDADHRTPQSL